jgi:hypothetical protein
MIALGARLIMTGGYIPVCGGAASPGAGSGKALEKSTNQQVFFGSFFQKRTACSRAEPVG